MILLIAVRMTFNARVFCSCSYVMFYKELKKSSLTKCKTLKLRGPKTDKTASVLNRSKLKKYLKKIYTCILFNIVLFSCFISLNSFLF